MLTGWGNECAFDPPYIVMARHAWRPEIALRYFESWLAIEKEATLIRVWSPDAGPRPHADRGLRPRGVQVRTS